MVARIRQFDVWEAGYGGAIVRIVKAGTTNLADVFTDEALSIAAPNPQTLLSKVENDATYGKFTVPLYTAQPFQLDINSSDTTGIERPALTTLSAQDASEALVTVDGGSQAVALEDHLGRRIDVRDYGVFLAVGEVGASSSTNNATLAAAIGVAGSAAGGFVEAPSGSYEITSVTLPAGVVLRGQGRSATTLQSTEAENVVTFGGARAGLSRMTLDGVSQVAQSVGVFAKAKDEIVFDDAEIKRFETAGYFKGGNRFSWKDLFISDCVDGIKAHGDLDTGGGSDGETFQFGSWSGGKVELCTGNGIQFENVDLAAGQFTVSGVGFDTNTGKAVDIVGARSLRFRDCWWDGNTNNITVADHSSPDTTNTVVDLLVAGGYMNGGTLALADTLETVIFEHVEFLDVDVTLTTPGNNVLALDCTEDDETVIAGTATAWQRRKSIDEGASYGLTSGNAATKAWAIPLAPGQQVYLEGKVVGRQRNGVNTGFYHMAVSAGRPGSTLDYDSQTANFTVGNVLTGGTSGATARITADSDSGTTGTLTLQDIKGTFIDNETITDGATGSATANGAVSDNNAALVGSIAQIRAVEETDANWATAFVANGPEIELQVTGATSQTIEWTVYVDVVST